jgi:hypothetical protein
MLRLRRDSGSAVFGLRHRTDAARRWIGLSDRRFAVAKDDANKCADGAQTIPVEENAFHRVTTGCSAASVKTANDLIAT